MTKTPMVALLTVLVPAVLGVGALALYGFLAVMLLFNPIPAANKDILAGVMNLIGGSLVGCAFGFYFGASMHAKAEPAPGVASLPRYGA